MKRFQKVEASNQMSTTAALDFFVPSSIHLSPSHNLLVVIIMIINLVFMENEHQKFGMEIIRRIGILLVVGLIHSLVLEFKKWGLLGNPSNEVTN